VFLIYCRYRFTYVNIGSAGRHYISKVEPGKENGVFSVSSRKNQGKFVAFKFRCCLLGTLPLDFPKR